MLLYNQDQLTSTLPVPSSQRGICLQSQPSTYLAHCSMGAAEAKPVGVA